MSSAALAAAGLFARERRETIRLHARLADLDAAQRATIRLLRLTAADLRAPALSLLAHAEQAGPPLGITLAGLARGLLDLAQGVLDQTDDPTAPRRLVEEQISLGPMLDVVVAQVAAELGPSRRAWRITPALAQIRLLADPRALHQVLVRVVTGAALATRDGDWIEISAVQTPEHLTLVVEDEGAGLPVGGAGTGPETRGLGVGLSLARRLMTAHGGTLVLESTARVGTRALMVFPASRLVAPVPPATML